VTGAVNLTADRYRGVSLAAVPVPLDEDGLRGYFTGRPAYRRTRYIVVRAAGQDAAASAAAAGEAAGRGRTAVVEVGKESDGPLFSPIVTVTLLAGPEETAFVEAPEADVGIPTLLAKVAAGRAPWARCVVVRGRYGHVGFIADPEPVRVTVVDVVPPFPAKLADQAGRVLDLAEDLPPVELRPEATDLRSLAATAPAAHYLFPCRAGSAGGQAGPGDAGDEPPGLAATVSYLDEVPEPAEWTLVGCERSRAIHDWFYRRDVPVVDMCPRALAVRALRAGRLLPPVLTKCCLLEDRVRAEDGLVVVPWGASLAQVRDGLALAAGGRGHAAP